MHTQRVIAYGCLLLLLAAVVTVSGQELERFRLREIEVRGLPELSDAALRDLTGLEEGESYSSEQLARARDTLAVRLDALDDVPFARVLSFEIDTLAGGTTVNLRAELDPGPEVWVRSLELTGPTAGQGERIRQVLRTGPGERFRATVWREDLLRAVEVLRGQGYPFAEVRSEQVAPEFDTDTVHVDLALLVRPGARATLERVEFAGLERTQPETARRAARLDERLYDPERVELARRRLLRTDWFADVSAGEVFRDREGRYGVLFEVREQPTSSVSGVLGFAAEDEGVAGAIDATLANLFGGGRAFDLHWRRDGPDSRAFSVAYLEPFLFGQPLDARVHLEQEVRDSFYVAVEFGGELNARVADEWTLSGSLRRRSITADSLAAGVDTTDYSLVGVGASLAYDTRDRRTNPRSGAYAKLGSERLFLDGERTVSQVGGAPVTQELAGIYRSTFDAEAAFPVSGGWVGYGALHGVDVASDGEQHPPIAEWEQLGGAATVRGFAERSLLAPRAGWGTVELRYLLGSRSRVYTLTDVVALEVANATRWEWSYGAGVQVDTGIGLLNVAVAVPGGEGFSAAVVHAQAVARF